MAESKSNSRRVSLTDVARHANLALSTVSMAMSGDSRIAAKTRQRVLKVSRELGYEPGFNVDARRMGARRAGRHMPYRTLGLLWSIQTDRSMARTSFYRELLDGVVEACWESDYTLMLLNVAGESRSAFTALSQVDGVIIPQPSTIATQVADDLDRPVVTILRDEPAADERRINVGIDDAEAVELAFAHLHEHGHRRIGYLGPRTDPLHGTRRYEAYLDCLSRYGLEVDETLVARGERLSWRDNAARCFRALIGREPRPTGLVVYNDMMALGALEAAQELGVSIPGDVSLVSIDNIREAATADPPLTTVSINIEQIGREAGRVLAQSVEQNELTARNVQMPLQLIQRASVGPPTAT